MKYSDLKKELDYGFNQLEKNNNIVFCFLGAPGVGKTQKILQYAQETDVGITQLLGSTLSPTDVVAAMPGEKGNLDFYFNTQVPWEEKVGQEKYIWFLDEATNTHPEVWKSFQKLINERELMGKKLGKNVLIVLAGNRYNDKAGSTKLSSAVSNRLTFRLWHYDNNEYLDYLTERYDVPELIAYLGWKPLGEDHFKLAISGQHNEFVAWPNPRSVERMAWRYEFEKQNNMIHLADNYLGDVGEGFAREFCSFLGIIKELPKLDQIKKDPDSVAVPKEPNKQYAILALLAQGIDLENFKNYIKFVNKLDVALQILFTRLISRKSDIEGSSQYADWICGNKALQSAVIGK